MYSSAQFLTYANTYLKERVKRGAIIEVEERMREQLQTASAKKTYVAPPPIPEKAFIIGEQPKADNVKQVAPIEDTKKKSKKVINDEP